MQSVPPSHGGTVRTLRSTGGDVDPGSVVASLRDELTGAVEGSDRTAVHQVRVACRRLLTFQRIAGSVALTSDLHWMRGAAAEVRDLDVIVERSLPLEIVAWFNDQRAAAQAVLRHELESTRARGLLEALGHLQPLTIARVQSELVRSRDRVLECGAALEVMDDDPHRERERLHDLRRALRQLRYTLAWVGHDPPTLRRLQSSLGGLNDLEQLDLRLDGYPFQARIVELRADTEFRAAASHGACLAAWCDARDSVAALVI